MADPAALDSFDATNVPNHIAIIMDGNGRWATAQGLPRTEGHKRGEDALFEAVEGCLAAGVKWMTVYAFSTENWRCLLYTSPSPRDKRQSRMPSSA